MNGKGGVGKTTVALLLAGALKRSGLFVTLDDRDPQKTASLAAKSFEVELGDAGDIVIVDTAPRLDHGPSSDGVASASKVIVVTTPSPLTLATTLHTIEQIAVQRGGTSDVFVVFNNVTNNNLSRDRFRIASEFKCKVLDASLRVRTAYQTVALHGWNSMPREARDEATDLALAILAAENTSPDKKKKAAK